MTFTKLHFIVPLCFLGCLEFYLKEGRMLYSIDSSKYIKDIPYLNEYKSWKGRLSDPEYQAIVKELNSRIEGNEIHTSSWMPGADWTDTVFQPIYEKACSCDQELAGKFFGLILWDVILNRDDVWSFGRYELKGIPIRGLTYFKLNQKP